MRAVRDSIRQDARATNGVLAAESHTAGLDTSGCFDSAVRERGGSAFYYIGLPVIVELNRKGHSSAILDFDIEEP